MPATPTMSRAAGLITHLTMWAENDEGLVNLIKASSVANLEGRVMRYPRMDKEVLSTYSKGVIASSGCPPASSDPSAPRPVRRGAACRRRVQDIFGKDNFYIELMTTACPSKARLPTIC